MNTSTKTLTLNNRKNLITLKAAKNPTNNSEKDLNDLWRDFSENIEAKADLYKVGKQNTEDITLIKNKGLEIIDRTAIANKISFEHAAVGVCSLFQCGAHVKGVTNRTITAQNYEFTKENLLYAASLSKCQYPLRAIARAIRDDILKIARRNKIPGHLFKRFKLDHPNFEYKDEDHLNEIMISCSDFQLDNPNIPAEVKSFLSTRDISRRNRK